MLNTNNFKSHLTKFLEHYGFLFIITIYFLFQFLNLGYRWVNDESWYIMAIPSFLEEGTFRIPTIAGQEIFFAIPPLLTLLEALLYVFGPFNVFTARIVPLAFGVLLLVCTYYFCRRQFGFAAALITAFCVFADNILFISARTVRPDIIVGAMQVLALWSFVRYLDNEPKKNLWLCCAAISAGVAVSSHPNGFLVPASLFIASLILVPEWTNTVRVNVIWSAVFAISVLPFVAWMCWHDHVNNYENIVNTWIGGYGRNSDLTEEIDILGKFWELIVDEFKGRYLDFIQWPYRIHIGLTTILALLGSFFSRNRLIVTIAFICLSHLIFYMFVNNSFTSARYMASMLPLVAMLYGYWIAFLFRSQQSLRLFVGLALVILIGGSQMVGNMIFHWKFRHADFHNVVNELRQEIPSGATVYGSMSFWPGMQDNNLYVPYMRKSWQQAVREYQPEYVIMDDRVMVDVDRWFPLRKEIMAYLEDNGEIVKNVNNPFYGQLKLYRVHYP